MKAVAANITRGLPVGARLDVADNTGAKVIQIIAVPRVGNRKRRYPSAAIGDMFYCSVKKGTPEMRRQVVQAVVVRTRRAFRRPDGTMIQFEDNACVIINENGDTKGTDIKGPVAREAAERWPRIAATASMIV
jgi:large subunit ribosomal protein L14